LERRDFSLTPILSRWEREFLLTAATPVS